MTDRPIIFSGPMVRALLDGRKTQTRRVLKPQPDAGLFFGSMSLVGGKVICRTACGLRQDIRLPAVEGDRLWVRETFNVFAFSEDGEEAWPTEKIPTAEEHREVKEAAYRFDQQLIYRESERARKWFFDQEWRSPIHMPRWASRLTLNVTEVRVQRLQKISEADAKAEGAKEGDWPDRPECSCDDEDCLACSHYPALYVPAFRHIWNSLHGHDAWDANPWVCAISFEVERANIDQAKETTDD